MWGPKPGEITAAGAETFMFASPAEHPPFTEYIRSQTASRNRNISEGTKGSTDGLGKSDQVGEVFPNSFRSYSGEVDDAIAK